MAVGTLEEDSLSVDQNLVALMLHAAETHLLGNGFDDSILVGDGGHECVQMGSLGTPYLGCFDLSVNDLCAFPFQGLGGLPYVIAVGIGECQGECLSSGLYGIHFHVECSVGIVVGKSSGHEEVLNMSCRPGIHVYFTCYAGKSPEVLVLAVGTVAPAHHLHGDGGFLSRYHIFGNIKFGCQFGVLAVSHFFSIYPQGEVAGGRTHVHIDAVSFPLGGNVECAAVRTCVIVLLFHMGRIAGKLCCPGITYVLVNLVSVSVHLKQAGYGEFVP